MLQIEKVEKSFGGLTAVSDCSLRVLEGSITGLIGPNGTGIPIQGIKKRGRELKVFVQLKKAGGIRVAGLDIGNYHSGWERLFKPTIDVMKGFKNFLLVTDGDTGILDSIRGKVKLIFQRCLWHIPHQMKYTLWQDKVKRKTNDWLHLLGEIMEICAIRCLVDEAEVIGEMIKSKKERLEKLVLYCKDRGYENTAAYLQGAEPDMFTAISNRVNGKTTSRVERVMRTINLRINRGKWSPSGALNATKIRLAYYYNGFDV